MTENEIGKVVVDAAIAVHKPLGVLSVLARWKKVFTQSRRDREENTKKK